MCSLFSMMRGLLFVFFVICSALCVLGCVFCVICYVLFVTRSAFVALDVLFFVYVLWIPCSSFSVLCSLFVVVNSLLLVVCC